MVDDKEATELNDEAIVNIIKSTESHESDANTNDDNNANYGKQMGLQLQLVHILMLL